MTLSHPDANATDNFVQVYGAELHYFEAGQGPLVILLHGLFGNACQWSNVMGRLAKQFYVIALDQIGLGWSDKPFLNYRIATLVDFLYGFYQALGIERAFLVGEGVGGLVATTLALQFPDLVERLVLVNAALVWAAPEDYGLATLLPPATREQTRNLLRRLYYNKNLYANDSLIDQAFMHRVMMNSGYTVQRLTESLCRREDNLDERLSELTIPTLLLHGREDELIPLAQSQRLHREIRSSELQVIERCGHLPHVEQPEEFSTAVLRFLNAQGKEQSSIS